MAKKRAPAKRRPRKAKAGTRGLTPAETRLDELTGTARDVAERVESAGGRLLGSYSDPLGKQPVLVAILPIDSVEPTPFQRDLSQVHHRKLADVLDRTGMFLDPIIAVTAPEIGFWTPNGMHRLMAMRRLGARSITALVVPKREIAWQILALNTEKAHNLREKSLETIRMARALAKRSDATEDSFAFEFEQPAFLTLGTCYEERPRLSGGAYQSILRRVDAFLDEPIAKAIKERDRRGRKILKLDDAVSAAVEKLKAKGLTSPYLKPFVVSRVNYTRFSKATTFDFDETLDKIIASAAKFNVDRVRQEDVAKSGGGSAEED
jgi:ParB family chromosome partitioning protein